MWILRSRRDDDNVIVLSYTKTWRRHNDNTPDEKWGGFARPTARYYLTISELAPAVWLIQDRLYPTYICRGDWGIKRRMPEAFSFFVQQVCLIAAGEARDAQQADEDVVQRHIQAHGRADVVGLTAVNNVAGFIQDRAG